MANATHKIVIGNNTASIVLSDVYDNTDSTIGAAINIAKVDADTALPAGTLPIDIGGGLSKGLLARLNIRYKDPGNANKVKVGRIICPIDKAYEAVTKLIGKTYRGGAVLSVSVPQRRRFT